MTIIKGDAAAAATTDEYYFSKKMSKAPLGQKLLVRNEGGCATFAILNEENRAHFKEWACIPKGAIDEEDPPADKEGKDGSGHIEPNSGADRAHTG